MILKELNKLGKSEKVKFLIEKKAEILKAKRLVGKTSDCVGLPTLSKAFAEANKADTGVDNVFEIVGNSVGFMDSHEDVSMKGSFTKTVKENGLFVPILKDHIHSTDAIFAKNRGVSVVSKSIKALGYDKEGYTEALVALIEPKYDAKMAQLYADGQIKQHSIGLQYVKLDVAVNDESDAEGFANWNKYIDSVINREVAVANGYFFPIFEQKLIEISAVLFGSNPYTPVISDKQSLKIEPLQNTQKIEPIKERGNDFLKYLNY